MVLLAHDAGAFEAPVGQFPLRLLVAVVGFRCGVPEKYFCIRWYITSSSYDLHVPNEASANVAVAAMIDVGSCDEHASCVMGFGFRLRRSLCKGGMQRRPGTAKGIESYDFGDKEPGDC